MENSQTKVCTCCKRVLPLEAFGKKGDGIRTVCKECTNRKLRQYRLKKQSEPSKSLKNPALEEFTPQELITELRARGYEGNLTFTEIKVHKIRV